MKTLKSKAFKIALGLTIVFFLSKYAIELRYGYIDYFAAFDIEYNTQENGTIRMSSNWYQFESETKWINFPYKPGCLGRGGYFVSVKGSFEYDYSLYAPDYKEHGYDSTYVINEETVNNTLIRFIESEDEFGIYIPMQ